MDSVVGPDTGKDTEEGRYDGRYSKRRRWGSGSVWPGRGAWYASYRVPGEGRKRRSVRCHSKEQAEAVLDHLARLGEARKHRTLPGVLRRPRKLSALEATRWAIRDGREAGWSDELLAEVIVASTRPKRLLLGVYGPCAYCGNPVANTVDHVVPRAAGGTDDRSNLVSCCFHCNSMKRAMSAEDWRERLRAEVVP